MLKAKPVWIKDREKELNLCASFRTVVPECTGKVILRLAASTVYNAYINGSFVSYGPARAGEGYYRVEELDISKYLTEKDNIIAIDVAGYNVDSYYVLNQPSFLQAEVVAGDDVLKYTGNDFECTIVKEKVQRIQRYSFQRPFAEAYVMDEQYNAFKTRLNADCKLEILTETEPKKLLSRNVSYPEFEISNIDGVVAGGKVEGFKGPKPASTVFTENRAPNMGYNDDELSVYLIGDADSMKFAIENGKEDLKDTYNIKSNTFKTFSFKKDLSGKIAFDITAEKDTYIYCLFDEILRENEVDYKRLGCTNVIRFDLKAGRYSLESFEVYTMMYLKIISIGSDCAVSNIHLIEYKHKPVDFEIKLPEGNYKLRAIYDAAVETYRQNAADLFTDCPSRERAGWLCDSFFLGRVEKLLTGKNTVERNFLENFILPEKYPFLPEGMFPMCYPANHTNQNYIPNWAMFLVLELEEYNERTGDTGLISAFKEKVYKLIDFFKGYENEDGLLEKLDKWIFVEWSKANDLVLDVNYPSNMLYSRMLKSAGTLYNDKALIEKSESIKKAIVEKSYNGEFFTDNAIRENGVLVNTNEATEVCQYYAFFCDIVKPEEYPELWNKLVNDFGPERKQNNKYPKIHFANAFIGNYLRLDILLKYGYKQKVLENIEGYFYYMAEKTGTLWENDGDYASCNHGFASHVLIWLDKIFNV